MTRWCMSCRSYHPPPRDADHAALLGCRAPRLAVTLPEALGNVEVDTFGVDFQLLLAQEPRP